MKEGRSLTELAEELARQQQSKRDFVAPTERVDFVHVARKEDEDAFGLSLNGESFGITRHAERQLGAHSGIPAKYYDRCRENAPELLQTQLNHWLHEDPSKQMIRTMDGNVRAWLSSKYRPLDNVDMMEATLPRLLDLGAQVESCQVTESKLYLKAIIPDRVEEVKREGVEWGVGHNPIHVLRPGIVISNSEIGQGAVSVQPGIHEQHCSNLAVFSRDSMRKLHVGKAADVSTEIQEYLTDETRRANDAAFWMTVADLVTAALDGRMFTNYVNEMKEACGQKIEKKPEDVVEILAEKKSLNVEEGQSVLRHLLQGGDMSKFGLQAAVTRAAQEVESYDRASELERLGGQIIELPKSEWETLAKAA